MVLGVLMVVIVGLTGCSRHDLPDESTTSSINGQSVRLDPATQERVGLAVWFSGQGGDAHQRMNEDWLNALRESGWDVASGDMQREGWGNPRSVADAAELVDWAEREAGMSARLFIAGSMGGLTSLNLMITGGLTPNCWYGTMPVIDTTTVGNVPGAEEQIRRAWGDSGVPAEGNPARNLTSLPADTAYRIVSSLDDSWVPASSNADLLLSALLENGTRVTTLTVSGEHGDPSHFDGDDLVEFAGACL